MANETDITALQLQKLLRPFENQSGIVGTNTGSNMINNIPLISTSDILSQYNISNLGNMENQNKKYNIVVGPDGSFLRQALNPPARMKSDFINVPQDYYPLNSGIMTSSTANTFGTPVDIQQGFTQNTPSDQGTNFQFLPSANEADETDEVKETKTGIAKLFDFLTNFIPGVGLLKRLGDVPGGIRSLNQRLRNTDFGQSRTGAEYMMRRRERKQAERARKANKSVYESADRQGFTNDRGGFSTSRADRAGTSLGSGQFSSKRSTGRQGY